MFFGARFKGTVCVCACPSNPPTVILRFCMYEVLLLYYQSGKILYTFHQPFKIIKKDNFPYLYIYFFKGISKSCINLNRNILHNPILNFNKILYIISFFFSSTICRKKYFGNYVCCIEDLLPTTPLQSMMNYESRFSVQGIG